MVRTEALYHQSALKQWLSKCVHCTSSSITRNVDSQAYLRPTESELLGRVHQSVLQPASGDSYEGEV